MSDKTHLLNEEQLTAFDGRVIEDSELEETASGEFAVYAAERPDIMPDEVHVFKRKAEPDSDFLEVVSEFANFSHVHELRADLSSDDRIGVLFVDFRSGVDNPRPGRDLANHLISNL
jgi:hypothetical protein